VTKTLFDVTEGDLLIVDSSRAFRPYIVKVVKTTPTRITTQTGSVWHKKNGREVGANRDAWSRVQIRLPEENEIDAIRLYNAIGLKLTEIDSLVSTLRSSRKTIPYTAQTLVTLINLATALEQLLSAPQTTSPSN